MRTPTRLVTAAAVAVVSLVTGCGGAVIEPGHRGLLFDPSDGGVRHDVLTPGYYRLSSCWFRAACPRIEDFDVSYSTRKEVIQTTSQEGLSLTLNMAVIFRPVIAELYELDTEIGPNYYDEVVGPEFRSAVRGVFARHSYLELQKANEKIENEVELEVRRRTQGKHVEIASVTMEAVAYAPEIAHAVQAKLVGEQESVRQKAALEAESLKRKLELEHAAEQQRLRAEAELQAKKHERAIEEQQAAIDKAKTEAEAQNRVIAARAAAEETTILAKAERERRKAENVSLSPLAVMIHAYDALGKLGGSGTSIMLGDWSKTPQFLFPRLPGFSALFGGGAAAGTNAPTSAPPPAAAGRRDVPASAPRAPAPAAASKPSSDNPYD